MTKTKLAIGLAALIAFLIFAAGWVMNVAAILASDFSTFTFLLAVRLLGVLVAPLGALMGYIG